MKLFKTLFKGNVFDLLFFFVPENSNQDTINPK